MPDRLPPARTRRSPRRKTADPAEPGRYYIDTGTVDMIADRQDSRGRILIIGGVPNSYVHLDDPTRLDFEYTRWIGDLIDLYGTNPKAPLRVTHLGGAGCTLPRYVSATRPGSKQVVFEYDAALIEFARDAFGLRRDRRLRLKHADARHGIAGLRDASQDIVIRDAFAGDRVPEHLTTKEFLTDVARVLVPGGVYVANVADRTTMVEARSEAATMLAVFRHVALVAEPAQIRGRRYGNVILFGSTEPLPLDGLTRRLASGAFRASLLPTEQVRDYASGHRPRTDAGYGVVDDFGPPAALPTECDAGPEMRDAEGTADAGPDAVVPPR